MRKIDKIPFTSFEQITKEYIENNKPVILQNALSRPSVFSWTPEYLKECVGSAIVKVNCANSGRYELDQERGGHTCEPVEMELGTYIDNHLDDNSYYLQQASLNQYMPSLLGEIPIKDIIDPNFVSAVNLWFGGAKTVSPLHYDRGNNLFIQCYGKKKFTLFEPDQLDYLYPYDPGKHAHPHVSQVNIDNPDFIKFPLFKNASPLEAIVEPGDILLIPSTTWHQVSGESVSISLNIWFKQFDFQLLLPAMLRLMPYSFEHLVSALDYAIPYRYTSFNELCLSLLSNNRYFESLMGFTAVLDAKIRQLLANKEHSVFTSGSVSHTDSARVPMEDLPNLLLGHSEFTHNGIGQLKEIFDHTQDMIKAKQLLCSTDRAIELIGNTRALISECDRMIAS